MAVLDEMKNLENQKKEFMAQLGEVYYKNCKADGTDVPGEAAGIIAKIDETDRQMKLLIEPETVRAGEQEPPVEEAEEVQSEYQGSVCPKCGAPVEPDQIFCVNCGTKLEEEAAEQTEIISDILNDIQSEEREKAADKEIDGPEENVCPRCGAPVEEDQGFCIICGAKLEKAGAGAAYQAEPERPAGPRICPNCGKVLPPQMRFCTSCGTKMN